MNQLSKLRVEYIPYQLRGESIIKAFLAWLPSPKWRLLEDYCYQLPDGTKVVIPKDFDFDGASVPRLFWMMLNPVGLLFIPGLIHDYAYKNGCLWQVSGQGEISSYGKNTKWAWDLLFRSVAHQLNGPRVLHNVAWLGLLVWPFTWWRRRREQSPIKPETVDC
jgi:hypothetical protein